MSFTTITEAYQAVYEPIELVEEFLSEDYDGIEELVEQDFDYIAEETIQEVLDEGIEVEELDDLFEAVIMELNPYAPAGSQASRAYQRSTSSSKRSAQRAAAVSAAKQKVGGAIKSNVKKVQASALKAQTSAQKTAKGLKQQSHVGLAKYADKHNLVKGAGLKTQSSKGRGEIRSAVVKHVGSKIKDKIKSAIGAVKKRASSVASAASSAKNKAVEYVKNKASAVKAGVKSAAGKAARKVATGASNMASRLGEEVEVDVFDVVLEHLLENRYADNNETAINIMVNMSEEWLNDIIEDYKEFPTNKVMTKAGQLMGSSAGKTDPKSKKDEKRGIRMMDTMMQHSPDR